MKSAVLIVQPVAEESAVRIGEIQNAIDQAVAEAVKKGVRGKKITPFLLNRVSELTDGKSLEANLALLLSNAALAAKIARELI